MPVSVARPADGARAHGPPLFSAGFRREPGHFDVTEILGFEPSGNGEHALLYVEKSGANTVWVARQLARYAGARDVDVGFAGQKDRHAVTRQWFSIRAGDVDWQGFEADGVRILRGTRHARKLKRGAHAGNAFRIVLSGVPRSLDFAALVRRIDAIRGEGVPNYFGEQRFGRRNLELARELFDGKRLKRETHGMALSAARALIFNAIVDDRVQAGTWNRILPGELANLDGTGSVFAVDDVDAALEQRALEADIHPTATLFGSTETYRATADVARLEEGASLPFREFVDGLAGARVDCAQRATRVMPAGLSAVLEGSMLTLAFRLPKGAYATTVLAELAELEDLSWRARPRARSR